MNRDAIRTFLADLFSKALSCAASVEDEWETGCEGPVPAEGAAVYDNGRWTVRVDSGCGAWRVRLEGLPKESRLIGRRVETLAKLAARRASTALRQDEKRTPPRSYFVKRLLDCRNEEDDISVAAWNAVMGYDLNAPRSACVFVPDLKSRPGIDEEAARRALRDRIRGHQAIGDDDIVEYINKDQLVVLKKVSADRISDYGIALAGLAADVDQFTRRRFSIATGCGIGFCYEGPRLLRHSYEEAVFALEKAGGRGAALIDRYSVEYLSEKIPVRILDHFLGEKHALLAARPELLRTVRALADADMRVQTAADSLSVHKNTLLLRIKAIKALLGIDPFVNEDDRMQLFFLAAYADHANSGRNNPR